jgi:hypothetical protein
MAAAPSFIATPVAATVTLSTANVAVDGSGAITDLLTGSTLGTRVLEVVIQGTQQTAAGLVNLFLYNGTAWFLFDQITVVSQTGNTAAKGTRVATQYTNLVLPNTWKLGCTLTVAPISGTVRVTALGGSL